MNLDVCKNCEDGDSYESEENYYKTITTGSDFSGVGAFDYAIERVCNAKGFEHERIFACDWDKFARTTYAHNHGEPLYFPKDVYDRDIPEESLDIYMTSPPCQAFSLAGKRKGKTDKRGILFFNSHEFIKVNKPRFFIFENVKGLLSDEKGRTFHEWVDMLGVKSVNGLPVLFPHDDALDYHLYWQVLNSKDFGVPQNRERVFLIGIRDDIDNDFRFPKKEHLTKRLKDVLESDVDEKYFLSDKTLKYMFEHKEIHQERGNGFAFNVRDIDKPASTISTKAGSRQTDNYVIQINQSKESGCKQPYQQNRVYDSKGILPALMAAKSDLKIKTNTKKGYETATEHDSINFSVPNSKTRRGRVGKGVAQTLDTACNQGIWIADYRADEGLRIRKDGNSPCMTSSMRDSSEWNPKAGTRNPPIVGINYKIRRLTPRECFRLQDFPETFDFSVVSNSQAYKQAGNSITVAVLEKIISNLNL